MVAHSVADVRICAVRWSSAAANVARRLWQMAAVPPSPPLTHTPSPRAAGDGAGLAWGGDLPRQFQQVLFDTAYSIIF
jgi:hypothetical protein